MKIITIHGIRRKNKWYKVFAEFDEIVANNIDLLHFEYGYLDIIRFAFPGYRQKIISRFQQFYSENIDRKDEPPSVICHSFGTYIFYAAIQTYNVIKFNRVILCGSILEPEIEWGKFFKRKQIKKVYHDYGINDTIVKWSKFVLGKYAGNSGEIGFKNIPRKYRSRFIQVENNFGHSSYFLPLHMESTWLPFLLEDILAVRYDRNILRREVIERLYESHENYNEKYTKALFKARIDDHGTYYANYSKEGIVMEDYKDGVEIVTTADAITNYKKMNFKAIDQLGRFLSVKPIFDYIQKKKVKIFFASPLKKHDHFFVRCFFKWENTMNFSGGDTDHFWVACCDSWDISLNFPKRLLSPKFIAFKDKRPLKCLPIQIEEQKDGTVSYNTRKLQNFQCDCVIFYYEGIDDQSILSRINMNFPHKYRAKTNESFYISMCREEDIKYIYKIECDIERSNAADEKMLYDRLRMFPYGFLVAKNQQKEIIGYLESTIWNNIQFERFSEINDFPLFYDVNGDTMYIIFLAVKQDWRNKHIGIKLIETAISLAREIDVKSIILVAKDERIGLYQKCGFNYIKELPYFLPGQEFKSILMKMNLKSS